MSLFQFGYGKGCLSKKARDQINAIAEKHDAVFWNPTLPDRGPCYWFEIPLYLVVSREQLTIDIACETDEIFASERKAGRIKCL